MRRPSRSGVAPPAVVVVVVVVAVAALTTVLRGPEAARPAATWECAGSDDSAAVSGSVVGAGHEACTPGALAVDGRTFTRGGEPFFWLGDTAWSLFVNLTRAETEEYLDARAAQGFTVVQAAAVFPQAGGPGPNQYGDSPHGTGLDDLAVTPGDEGEEQYDYWDHVDFVVAQAAERGLVLAVLPVWADGQVGELLTEENAGAYGEFLGHRYGGAGNVVWVLGGDAPADGVEGVWQALADGIREGGGTQPATYHPRGDQTSVTWFDGDERIGFHMLQGGHCLRYDVRAELVAQTYAAGLPFVDGEPIYEDHPYCWRPADGYSTAQDVRRDAYWSVLGGAAGHTYGHHAVWQFLAGGRSPELHARGTWPEALRSPGAEQMQNVRALAESRPRVEPAAVVADPGEGAGRIQAAVAADGSTLMAYTAAGREVALDPGVLAGTTLQPWWFDPRSGDAVRLDPVENSGPATFTPPAGEGDEADWVLVVDDAAAAFGAPGAGRLPGRDAPASDRTGASGRDLDDPDAGFGPDDGERKPGEEESGAAGAGRGGAGGTGSDEDGRGSDARGDGEGGDGEGGDGEGGDGEGRDRGDGDRGEGDGGDRGEERADAGDGEEGSRGEGSRGEDEGGGGSADDDADRAGGSGGEGDRSGEGAGSGDRGGRSGDEGAGDGDAGDTSDREAGAEEGGAEAGGDGSGEPERGPAGQEAPAPAAADAAVWERLAACESSGDWGIDTGNGYYGGLQFSDATWKDYGGTEFAPQAHLATREEQILVATRVRDDRGGYGSWPACASRLGLPRWSW
ncbi:apiosidase-like domain-containing protein [Pseudonocardia sichuanensis]